MLYLVIGAGLLALLVSLGRAGSWSRMKGEGWRVAFGAGAIAVFSAAAFLGIRGAWGTSLVLLVVGLGLATAARGQRARPQARAPQVVSGLTAREARDILGVSEGASPEQIQAAYGRLIRMAHPDKGGTAGLAAQLNAARDRLLKR
ncbi:J domain-containing protein [Caulobacter sp. NIBR2454]|uniref:J domain-containing protein n=1 Tax=Caulobacter sp. NIBR2454 TaxID=3015996 RepID=UPI0022B6469E|nr:DnaJ domain-containing protein [Caulobacter sp. NIBR2454]